MNLVTIVIPTWNRPLYLKRCLSSILAQTFKGYEVVVVDDHSTMESQYKEVVDEYLSKFLLHYVRLPINRGSQYCRNKGVDMASGRYVAFVDDDDEWLPGKLEKQIEAFENGSPDLGLVYTWTDSCDTSGQIMYKYRESYRGNDLKPLLDYCFIASSSVMCKLEAVVKANKFDENFPSCQDWDMWTSIVEAGYGYDVVKEILAIHHIHNEFSIGKSLESPDGFKIFFEKHTPYYLKSGMQINLSEKYRSMGWSYFIKGDINSALKLLFRSIDLWKLNLKTWIRLIQVYWARIVRKILKKRASPQSTMHSKPVVVPKYDGLRFNNGVLSNLMVDGNNIIEPWGVEFADTYSFFSLENGIGYRYEILDKNEQKSDTARSISLIVKMQEGLVKLNLKEWLEESISIRRILNLTCLEKTNLMDFVLRYNFKNAFFENGVINNQIFKQENLPIYHQYNVDFAEVRNREYGIQVRIVNKIVPPNMTGVMYLKSAEGCWVIHARMLPYIWKKEVIKLCSNIFKTKPIPQPVTKEILKSKQLRDALWYRGERFPYRNRIARLFSPNAYPIAEMQKGEELIWDVRCMITNAIN